MAWTHTYDRLPFIWAPLDHATGGDFPEAMPFTLGVDGATGRMIQIPDPVVDATMEEAYAKGSMIAGRMDEEGLGRRYADDFLDFMTRTGVAISDSRVLEIGSGTGYLLSRLNEMGADTVGVEPGDHGQHRFERPGVRLVRDFFPSSRIDGTFDTILMYSVLEHVAMLEGWFEALHRHLEPGGKLVISVPACEPFIEAGDLSMLVHEHYNYFTKRSLGDTLGRAGFGDLDITGGGLGGSLYCLAGAGRKRPAPDVGVPQGIAERFRMLAESSVRTLRDYLVATHDAGESVALYVPIRAANFIVLGGAPVDHCRFFDDDPLQQGHYLPGLDVVVEGQEALVETPTDHVLIMSRSFASQIRERLLPAMPADTRFTTAEELLAA